MGYGQLVNSHRPFPAGPGSLFAGAWRERRLIHQLIRREVLGRYRGSMVGLLWSLLHPLLMLAVYTFVFSVVFEAKWPGVMGGDGRVRFALLLFLGVVCHGLLAGWDAQRIGVLANAAGALVSSRLTCADAMPTLNELEALLGGAA